MNYIIFGPNMSDEKFDKKIEEDRKKIEELRKQIDEAGIKARELLAKRK